MPAALVIVLLALKEGGATIPIAPSPPRAPTLGAAASVAAHRAPHPLGGPLALPTLAAIAVVPCSLAFHRVAFSFTLSYALSIAAIGVALLLFPPPASDTGAIARVQKVGASAAESTSLQLAAKVHAALLVAYGARLLAFLLHRSRAWPGWDAMVRSFEQTSSYATPLPSYASAAGALHYSRELVAFLAVRLGARLPLVLGLATFYALQCAPALFHVQQPRAAPRRAAHAAAEVAVTWLGLTLSAAGLALEAAADAHKLSAKLSRACLFAQGTDVPVMDGPFVHVRHANYLGELAFWLGSFVAGLPPTLAAASALGSAAKVLAASAGLGGIVRIMLGASQRLDAKQRAKYADPTHPSREAYASYRARTPRLLPAPGLR